MTDHKEPLGDHLRAMEERRKKAEPPPPSAEEIAKDRERRAEKDRKWEDEARRAKEEKLKSFVSDVFNIIADRVPAELARQVERIKRGSSPNEINEYRSDSSGALDGVVSMDFSKLPGYQALDAVCKKMNVDFNIVVGFIFADPYDSYSVGCTVLKVTVDPKTPYSDHPRVSTPDIEYRRDPRY